MVVGKPRDDKRTFFDQLAFFPASSIILAVFLAMFSYVSVGENLTYQLVILIIGFAVSLFFSVAYNQKKTRNIKADEYGVGKVVYSAIAVSRWIWLLIFQMFGALFLSIPWFIVSVELSRPLLPAFTTLIFVWIWLVFNKKWMPNHYCVTKEGIWFRNWINYSFVYFDDLEQVYFDAKKTRFQLTTGSMNWTSLIKCSGFIILSIKPERKLQKEYRQQAITLEKPQAFLDHMPKSLIINACNQG